MYPVPINDVLEVVKSDQFEFTSSGLDIPGAINDNLCVKAFNIIRDKYAIPNVHAHLYKSIPMGGGLGGGSSDATEMLKLLNSEFELSITNKELKEFASQLGSDCPFFVENKPQVAFGRGEELKTIGLDLSGYYLLLINDGTHVSTKDAYSNVNPRNPEYNIEESVKLPIEKWKDVIHNQFEESVFGSYQHLKLLKESIYSLGAIYASMTGSGATMYGLFEEKPDIDPKRFGDINFLKIIQL
tara:strand:+ start:25458 stop:26183 length:726 start_codon:yes stop_codon:yes gene_type:complete